MSRKDILSVSIGPENIRLLKDEARREGLPVSRVVAAWVQELADSEADDE